MTTWKDFETAEPEFTARVRRILDAHKHKTIATLRADGSPRISGIEIASEGGELTFGSAGPATRRSRVARCTAASWAGETTGDGFRIDLTEVVHTG